MLPILRPFSFARRKRFFAAGHGAVFIHDLTAQAGGLEPRKAGKVDGRFGMTLPFEDTPATCFQREEMSRAAEIFRLRRLLSLMASKAVMERAAAETPVPESL